MRILILTSYKTGNIYKVNYLTERREVVGKIIERGVGILDPKQKKQRRLDMIKKYGLIKTANKLLYNKYKQRFLEQDFERQTREILFPGQNKIDYTHDIPALEVPNINSPESIEFIKNKKPDVIAVCGTSLIKPEVFKLAPKGTINIHSGITPEYRSNESVFWALYNQEPDKVGVTIHYIDSGIDTGRIIYQQNVGVSPKDNLATLYCKCQITGIELMNKALDDIVKGTVKTIQKEKSRSRAYFTMDLGIWQYFCFLFKFKQLKKSI